MPSSGAVACFVFVPVLAAQAFLLPPPTSHRVHTHQVNLKQTHTHTQKSTHTCTTTTSISSLRRPLCPSSSSLLSPLRARQGSNNDDPNADDLQKILDSFLRGDRQEMEDYAQERRLKAEQEEIKEKGLFGELEIFLKNAVSKAPLLFLAPVVLWGGIQLSGIAVAVAMVSALAVASFALPPLFAMTFLFPLLIFMIIGTFVFPILPFAILGFLPGYVLLPLLFLGGYFLLNQGFGGFGRERIVIREEGRWVSPFEWGRVEGEEEGGRGGERGVIDVKGETVEEGEEEDGGDALRDFDRRLRDK